MRTVKRTFFNKLFQPKRIGKMIRWKLPTNFKDFCKRGRTTVMQRERRAHQGQANAIIGRYATLDKYLTFNHIKKYKSKFVRRAQLND